MKNHANSARNSSRFPFVDPKQRQMEFVLTSGYVLWFPFRFDWFYSRWPPSRESQLRANALMRSCRISVEFASHRRHPKPVTRMIHRTSNAVRITSHSIENVNISPSLFPFPIHCSVAGAMHTQLRIRVRDSLPTYSQSANSSLSGDWWLRVHATQSDG